ncbi:phage tail protein [Cupriavidus plantarum]|uniref:phage tail protein n=1 Tax=Cupriavidus plantarum TaxID=942865 RepID=UPI000EB066C5|nr:phage tail protein [Cupriavidus plantarum]RLK45947.1 tail tube protein [Cupriavidus plantarum]
MSVKLPNGAIHSIATALAAAITITALSNANPAQATAAAHGLANGDVGVITSGWPALDGRVVRVIDVDQGTFALEGIDTTDTARFPAGAGIGTFRKVQTWQPITQVLESSMSGGEQQFYNYQFLEDTGDERQIPTIRSARAATLQIADDDSLPQYGVLETADTERQARAVSLVLPSGSKIYYAAIVSFNKVPTLTKNQAMALTVTLSIQGEPTRYSGAQA